MFYQPSTQGFEGEIKTQVARHREAQLEAVAEGVFVSPVEVLTTGPTDRTVDRWLQRTLSQVGEQLAGIRDRIFTLAQLQRHHVVLDLNAGSGLLTFEALRRLLKRSSFTSTEDLQYQILDFIDYFNRTLAKPFVWKFVGFPESD